MKKLTCLLILVCLLLLPACSQQVPTEEQEPTYINQDIAVPTTKEMLTEHADIIIVAEVLKVEIVEYQLGNSRIIDGVQQDVIGPKPVTVSTVLIEQSLKGDVCNGQEMKVAQYGDGKTLIYSSIEDGGGYLVEGSKVMLFLRQLSDEINEHTLENNDMVLPSLVLPLVGHYKLDESNNIVFPNNHAHDLFSDSGSEQGMNDMVASVDAAITAASE